MRRILPILLLATIEYIIFSLKISPWISYGSLIALAIFVLVIFWPEVGLYLNHKSIRKIVTIVGVIAFLLVIYASLKYLNDPSWPSTVVASIPDDSEFSVETSYITYNYTDKVEKIDLRFKPGDKLYIEWEGSCPIGYDESPIIIMKIGKGNDFSISPYYIRRLQRIDEFTVPLAVKSQCPDGLCFPRFFFGGCLNVLTNKLYLKEFKVNGVSKISYLPKGG